MAESIASVNDVSRDNVLVAEASVNDAVLQRYRLLERIGSGGYGDVMKALHLSSNTLMAMKKLRKLDSRRLGGGGRDDAVKELRNLLRLGRHAHIACCYDAFEFNATHHAIVMELFDMDLTKFLKNVKNRAMYPSVLVSLHSVSGLAFLHAQKPMIIHRDIKPHNVLVKIYAKTGAIVAKLADFGISSVVKCGDVIDENAAPPSMERLTEAVRHMITTVGARGTRPLMAPEFFAASDGQGLVDGRFRVDASVDIFALGLVYLYIFCYNTSDYGT